MESDDLLGMVEFAVLSSVASGALRSRCTAQRIRILRGEPAAELILHDVLRRCEQDGLLRSVRDATGRRYQLTATGRVRLRVEGRFRAAMVGVVARTR
jgi:hypothetical protein